MGAKRGRGKDKVIPFQNDVMEHQAAENGSGAVGRFMKAESHKRRVDLSSLGSNDFETPSIHLLETRRPSILSIPEFSLQSPQASAPSSPDIPQAFRHGIHGRQLRS